MDIATFLFTLYVSLDQHRPVDVFITPAKTLGSMPSPRKIYNQKIFCQLLYLSSPKRTPSDIASEVPIIDIASAKLLHNFVISPDPDGPQCTIFFPIICSTG
jgi:hypothetical protein